MSQESKRKEETRGHVAKMAELDRKEKQGGREEELGSRRSLG